MLCKQYYNFRKDLKDGDIVVYHFDKLIFSNYFEDGYYSHVGIVKWINERVFTIEIWNNQIILYPLSKRMKNYHNFYILRAKNKTEEEISLAINTIFEKVDNKSMVSPIKKFLITIYRELGISLFNTKNNIQNLSSELVKTFTNKLSIKSYTHIQNIKPKDFMSNADEEEMEIFFELK